MKQIIHNQRQIIFFVVVGAFSALTEIVLMKFFSFFIPKIFPSEANFYGVKYPLSSVFSTVLAILLNYWLSIKFVFEQGKHGRRREFAYFVIFSGITTVLSLFVFQMFINFVFLQPIDFKVYTLSPIILSKGMAIGIVSTLNYVVKKNIIFNG